MTTVAPEDVPAHIEHAIFFDNQPHHLQEVGAWCKNTQLVTIDQTAPDPPLIKFDSPEFHEYLQRIDPGHTYADYKVPEGENYRRPSKDGVWKNVYIYLMANTSRSQSDPIDIMSGIQESHLPIVDAWLEETRASAARVALFDWDRTLSMVEGMRIPIQGLSDSGLKRYVRDGLQYICGGDARIKMLRDLFRKLVSAGVMLIVLTNNNACEEPQFKMFTNELFGDIPYFTICSLKEPFRGNKGYALALHKEFRPMCATPAPPPAPTPAEEPTTRPRSNAVAEGGARRRRRRTARRSKNRRASRRKRV